VIVPEPVIACWAKDTEPNKDKAAEPAKTIFATFMEVSRTSSRLGQAATAGFVPGHSQGRVTLR
jgi:hypothetical protein